MLRLSLLIPCCTLSLLLLTFPVVFSQVPAIKGHAVGETMNEFLATSPMLTGSLRVCRAAKDQKAARKAHLNWRACQQLIAAMDTNAAITVSGCGDFGVDKDADPCVEFSGEVLFDEGKLQTMAIRMFSPWDVVYEDLVKRFGKPTGTGTELYQNLYGANFTVPNATWMHDDFSVVAVERISTSLGILRSTTVTLMTKDIIERALAAQAARKSTLD